MNSNEDKVSIVLAWVDEGQLWNSKRVAKAAMWLNEGTSEDVENAKNYAKKDGRMVFVFPASETDPLNKARALALAAK